jgi:RNA polymerase sigma-70 factor (ECF subfamily)
MKGDAEQEAGIAADIVRRISAGDRAAEAEMVRRYARGLAYVLRRRTSDRELAEDLAQETFRIAIERLRGGGKIDKPEALAAFLYGTGRNLVIAHQRKELRRHTLPDSEAVERVADEARGPYDDVAEEQDAALVRRLLDEMTVARDREILRRVYVQDQDKDEICRELGLDSLHFNRVLHRARQRFGELLKRAGRRSGLRLVEGGRAVGSADPQ